MKTLLTVVAACAAVCSLVAEDSSSPQKAEWHFPVHLSYVSGLSDIVDTILEGSGDQDSFEFPIGLSFQPYLMFPSGFGVGVDVGPIVLVGLDVGYEDTEFSFLLPLGAYVRYDFARNAKVSPYIRAGVRQCLTTGDLMQDGSVGFNAGLGVEFNRDRPITFGFEAGFDTSKIEVLNYWSGNYSEEKPFGFLASAFLSF